MKKVIIFSLFFFGVLVSSFASNQTNPSTTTTLTGNTFHWWADNMKGYCSNSSFEIQLNGVVVASGDLDNVYYSSANGEFTVNDEDQITVTFWYRPGGDDTYATSNREIWIDDLLGLDTSILGWATSNDPEVPTVLTYTHQASNGNVWLYISNWSF